VSDANFQLAELSLVEKQQASLELHSLNTKAQQVTSGKSQSEHLDSSDLFPNVCR